MKFTIAGGALIVVWMILVAGIAPVSGWAHLPLAVGVVLIAMGIVTGGEEGDRG